MKLLFGNATARLALRAALVGAGTLIAQLVASEAWDASVLRAALVAGGLAALEVFTPLNGLVGYFKLGKQEREQEKIAAPHVREGGPEPRRKAPVKKAPTRPKVTIAVKPKPKPRKPAPRKRSR